MVGVDVRTGAAPMSPLGPIRGPQGPAGPPGDPTALLAPLAPGDALSVDEDGRPASLGPVVGRDEHDSDLTAKADLVGGVIPSAQLPQVAITSAQVVPDRAAMLALDVQQGDIAVVVEDDDGLTRTYILAGEDADPTDFGSWVALPSPGDVNSVNGHVGVVVLNAAAVGAIARLGASASGTRVPITDSAGAEGVAVVAVSSPLTSTIVRRTGTGQIVAADAVNSNEAVTKAQLDKPSSIGLTGASEIAVRGATDVWGRVLMTAAPTASTVAYRGSGGTLKANAGTASDDLVTRAQLDSKVSVTATPWVLHGTNGSGVEVEQAMGNTPSGNSVIRRDAGGRAQVTDGSSVQDIATLGQVQKPSTFSLTLDGHIPVRGSTDTWARAFLSVAPSIATVPLRTASGALKVGPAGSTDEAVPLSQLNARLSAAQRTAIDALPTSGATVDQVVAALKAT